MPAMKWVHHPETGATEEVLASAVPVLATSGWQELSPEDSERVIQERRDAKRAAVLAFAPDGAALSATPETVTPRPTPRPKGRAVTDAPTTAATTPEKES